MIDASGAGVGGLPPTGQGWNPPFASAQPCRPVVSCVPRLYTYTGSLRPELFLIVSGMVAGTASADVSGPRAISPAATTRAERPDASTFDKRNTIILHVGAYGGGGEVRRSRAYELTAESALSLDLRSTSVNGPGHPDTAWRTVPTLRTARALA